MIKPTQLLPVCNVLTVLSPQMRLSQLRLLILASKHQPISQTDLAVMSGMTLAAVSRNVDVLGASGRRDGVGSALGLVCAEEDPTDGRKKLVRLTEKGENLLQLLTAELN